MNEWLLARRTTLRTGAFWFGLVGLFTTTAFGTLLVWAVVPSLFGRWDSSVVVSGSMTPTVRTGDVVVWHTKPSSPPDRRTVVLFADDDGRLTMHRVVDRTIDGRLVTKGDANNRADTALVSPQQVRGVGQLLVPLVGLPNLWWRQGDYAFVALTLFALVLSAYSSRFVWSSAFDPWVAADDDLDITGEFAWIDFVRFHPTDRFDADDSAPLLPQSVRDLLLAAPGTNR